MLLENIMLGRYHGDFADVTDAADEHVHVDYCGATCKQHLLMNMSTSTTVSPPADSICC